ncbi:transposase, partial [Aliarcobacter butzleri]|uniref:transposase n=1 Tax=Aliarcobacter butzleri TaxID=28197 RepID=UPI002B241B8C
MSESTPAECPDVNRLAVRIVPAYASKAVYTVLGVNMEGKKDILGLYLSESEGANFWLSVLT